MMFDFIWRMRGSITLDGLATDDEILERIERLLAKQGKPVSIRDPGHVAFNAPLWNDPFQPNWLAMIIYNSGRFWIDCGQEGRRLRYDLSSLHGFVFCLITQAGPLIGGDQGCASASVCGVWEDFLSFGAAQTGRACRSSRSPPAKV